MQSQLLRAASAARSAVAVPVPGAGLTSEIEACLPSVVSKPPAPNSYWEGRRHLLYYQVVRQLAEGLGNNARSMLDVGSAGCPYLEWFQHIGVRVSLDAERPYEATGIESIREDFLHWPVNRTFDIVTCLQVLEHVEQPAAFARKLLAAGNTVIVSVPHEWPADSVSGHRHDPVTERKMRSWFGREPNFSYVCREVVTHSDRLIQVYEASPLIWSNLNKRAKLRVGHTITSIAAPSTLARIVRTVRKRRPPKLARHYWSLLLGQPTQ